MAAVACDNGHWLGTTWSATQFNMKLPLSLNDQIHSRAAQLHNWAACKTRPSSETKFSAQMNSWTQGFKATVKSLNDRVSAEGINVIFLNGFTPFPKK